MDQDGSFDQPGENEDNQRTGGPSFHRREVLAGFAASSLLPISSVAAQTTTKPRIQIIRHPNQARVYGVGIVVSDGDPAIAPRSYALFPAAMASGSRPRGWHGEQEAIDDLDRFTFSSIAFSDSGGSYELDFRYKESDVSILVRMSRNGGKAIESQAVPLIDFLDDKARPVFTLPFASAKVFRWDLFGERVEVIGKTATLSLGLETSKSNSTLAASIEPKLKLVLEPCEGGKIFAFEKSISIRKLRIYHTAGNEGDGARIQQDQEPDNDKPSAVWLGEAEDLDWDEVRGIPTSSLRNYEIGPQSLPRSRPALRIVQAEKPTRLTLRQWGSAYRTLAVLRAPFTVSLLSPSATRREDLPPAVFPLQSAILTKQDLAVRSPPSAPDDVRGERLRETISGRLNEKPFNVETAYGAFIVEGDPPPVRDPGTKVNAKSDTPPPRYPLGFPLKQREEFPAQPEKGMTQFLLRADADEIVEFDARALLRQMTVALPDRSDDDSKSIEEAGSVWSRLTFSGTEIAFRLHLPNKAAWPSARGIVTLGQAPVPLPKLTRESTSPGRDDPAQVQIALDGARLDARRDSDNLALTFAFARMVLQLGAGGGRIVPNQKQSGAGAGEGAVRAFDDRSLLIVHFPPQHVAEKVYARQANDGITLPAMPSAIVLPGMDVKDSRDFAESLHRWREKGESRQAIFKSEVAKLKEIDAANNAELKDVLKKSGLQELLALRTDAGDATSWVNKLNLPEAQLKALVGRWNTLPHDQRAFYLGGSALAIDPDARKVWLDIWRAYRAATASNGLDIQTHEARLKQLPEDDLTKLERDALRERLSREKPANQGESDERRLDREVAAFMRRKNPDFALVADLYENLTDENGKRLAVPQEIAPFYPGSDKLKTDVAGSGVIPFVKALLAAYQAEAQKDEFLAITPARLSGPSRLVFRFDSAGGSFDGRDPEERSSIGEATERARRIPFSLVGLTDWGRFDLAVVRRAETLEVQPGGRIPHPTLRGIDFDPGRNLAHKGIRRGASIEGRLADIVASLKPPTDDESSIELPFRMQLSPDQFGRFRTRRTIATDVLALSKESKALAVPPLLWSANLDIGEVTPTVRAVWSQDFRPEAIVGLSDPPKRGPWAPWQTEPERPGDRVQFRTAMDAYDRHEIVGLTSVYGFPVMGRRNDLENLTDASQFEPPDDYRLAGLREYKGGKSDLSAIYNPASLSVSELRLTALGGSLRHDSPFVPPAAAVRKGKGALFGAFAVERWRQTTVLGRDIEVEVVYKGYLFPLGVRAALIKLTERRFVRNPHNGAVTAFLIQRKFIRIGKPTKNFPAAGQADGGRRFPVSELTMLTRETPDIVDPDLEVAPQVVTMDNAKFSLTANGRIESDSMADSFTKDRGLCFWPRTRPGPEGNIPFEFNIDGDASPLRMAMVFVDNRAANNPDVLASLATYYNFGSSDDAVDGTEALRRINMGGARRRYAEENQDGECHHETYEWHLRVEGRAPGSTSPVSGVPAPGTSPNTFFESDPLLQGSDQPPFYPYIRRAKIRLGQVERFVGRALPTQKVSFDDDYRVWGFPRNGPDAKGATTDDPLFFERYLQLAAELALDMGSSGDRSGGIGRPAIDVLYLSRRFGPMPKDLPKTLSAPAPSVVPAVPPAAPPNPPLQATDNAPTANQPSPPPPPFNLENFFGSDAKLLGLISFKELLSLAGCVMPDLKEKIDAATEETADLLRQTILPEISRALKSLETMWQNAQSTLTSHAAATRNIAALNIDTIYPDIAPALGALTIAVNSARETESSLELIGAMSEVQTCGRRFVTAIGRTLADPIAPLRDEVRQRFRILSDQIAKFGEGFSAFVDASFKGLLDEIKNTLKTRIVAAVSATAPVSRTMRLMLSLPIPDEITPVPDEAALKLASVQLDAAIAAGVKAFLEHALDAIGTGLDVNFVLQQGCKKALEAAKTNLAAAEASATGAIKPTIAAYRAKAETVLNEYASNAKAEIFEQIEGPLYPVLFGENGLAGLIAEEWTAVAADLKSPDAVGRIGVRIGAVLKLMTERLVHAGIAELCNAAAGKLADAMAGLLPPIRPRTGPNTDPSALDPFITAVDDLQKKVLAAPQLLDDLRDVKRYRKLRDRLVSPQFVKMCSGDDDSALAADAAKLARDLTTLKDSSMDGIADAFLAVAERLTTESEQVKTDATPFARLATERLAAFIETPTDRALAAIGTIDAALPKPADNTTPVGRVEQEMLGNIRRNTQAAAASLNQIKAIAQTIHAIGQDPARDSLKIATDIGALLSKAARSRPQFDIAAKALAPALQAAQESFDKGVNVALSDVERQLRDVLSQILMAREAASRAAITLVGEVFSPVFVLIKLAIYDPLDNLRKKGREAIKIDESAAQSIIGRILLTLRGPNGQPLTDIFAVPPVSPDAPFPDAFDTERGRLDRLISVDINSYLADLAALAEVWRGNNAAPLVLLRNLGTVLTAVLRGDLAQFVDLQQIRREVDATIRRMVPARIKRSFDMKLDLSDIKDLVKFSQPPRPHPIGGSALVLRATGVVDLLDPAKSSFEAEGYLPGFTLNLLPPFEVVTLGFQPATFSAGLGKPFHVAMKIDDVKLGEKVEFLKKLEPILGAPKDGSGFFLRIMTGRGGVGLTAGYALPIPAITIGNMFIDNLSLSAAAELPFDSGDARFVVSVSRPEAPFMIAAAPYAGAGHFGLIANTKGVVGFEASFQYGGGGGFSFGPLKGKGRISVGVFIRSIEGFTELYGLFYAGGSAQIACFSCGAQLNVRLQQQGGNLSGEAIFTFSFSLGIKDIEFSITVFKKEPGSGSSSSRQAAINLEPHEYRVRNAFAAGDMPRLFNDTECKGENYAVYRSYFSPVAAGVPKKRNAKVPPVKAWVMS